MSEGRDRRIIERIAASVSGTGCRLLDVHSDVDHHRTVLTLIGDAEQIAEGAIALAERATALIDLRAHRGVHPRIGAVDVIPFIPIGLTEMAECVFVAHRVGRTIASELSVPILYYGAAARSERRVPLPAVRRGGFEELSERLLEESPDAGPPSPHPTAGAIAVGARPLLVAYNVVLASNDLAAARRIASSIRESNGGLPGVRALGLELGSRHLVQVSMNLTDVAATPILAAFQAVSREAKALGIEVLESEIVGLVPLASLAGATASGLRMSSDPHEHVLETRIAEEVS